jgi:hypothetical protein
MRSETVFLAIFDDFDKIGRFLGVFGRKRGKFGANYVWFFADIAPRPRGASQPGKNPPIYTVLNAGDLTPGKGKIKFSMKLEQKCKKRNLTNLYIKNRK